MCGSFKRFETGLVSLEPQISFWARNPFFAKCPHVGKTQTHPILVLRLWLLLLRSPPTVLPGLAGDFPAQQGTEMDPTSDFSLLIPALASWAPSLSPVVWTFTGSNLHLDNKRGGKFWFSLMNTPSTGQLLYARLWDPEMTKERSLPLDCSQIRIIIDM